MLDDYQEITNRVCHDSLSFFLERTPSNVTLVVSTRSDPPIPMGRLRALEELLELRAVHLSFTEAESAIFLNEILQLGLTTETLGALHERTEGWPVGVHLAAMSLSDEADPEGFVARFGGASRHIVDYLTEVVLERSTRSDTSSCSRPRSSTRCPGLSATQPPAPRVPPRCWSSSSEPTSS